MKPKKGVNVNSISTYPSLSPSPSPSSSSLVLFRDEIKKIRNSGQFGEKARALEIIGNILYDKGYETAFIAGLLANIKHEGNFGFF